MLPFLASFAGRETCHPCFGPISLKCLESTEACPSSFLSSIGTSRTSMWTTKKHCRVVSTEATSPRRVSENDSGGAGHDFQGMRSAQQVRKADQPPVVFNSYRQLPDAKVHTLSPPNVRLLKSCPARPQAGLGSHRKSFLEAGSGHADVCT